MAQRYIHQGSLFVIFGNSHLHNIVLGSDAKFLVDFVLDSVEYVRCQQNIQERQH